jgi:hypothetical protein
MANWYGAARTNYFRVKDEAAFKAWLDTVPDVGAEPGTEERGGKFCLLANGEYGDFPGERFDEDDFDSTPFDIVAELAAHLAEGEVAVFMQAGAEKLRYISGFAIAVNAAGERVELVLDDIYEIAEKRFGVTKVDRATY